MFILQNDVERTGATSQDNFMYVNTVTDDPRTSYFWQVCIIFLEF